MGSTARRDYLVTVCRACGRASCWHGELFCHEAEHAGTMEVAASKLRTDALEHRSHFSIAKIKAVCGSVTYLPPNPGATPTDG